MGTIERIKKVINLKSETVNSLSKKIGFPQTSVSQWMSESRRMPLDFVDALLDLYPDLSAEWLLKGKGEMFLTPEEPELPHVEDPATDIGIKYFEQLMEKMKKEMKEEIITELKQIG